MKPSDIRALRLRLGMSVTEFGRALKFDSPNKRVRELESGSRSPSPQMVALMEALETIQRLQSGT